MKLSCLLALCSCLLATACQTARVGVAEGVTLPKDAANTCRSQCTTLGLHLTSVVTVADNVGCVCSVTSPLEAPAPGSAPLQTSDAATATASGAIVVMLQNAAQQRRSQASTRR